LWSGTSVAEWAIAMLPHSFRLAALSTVFVTLVACGAPSHQDAEEIGSTDSALVTATGVDYSFARPSPGGLYAEGYTFAARYFSHDASKDVSKAEADALWAAKVDVISNWEATAQGALNGHAQGVADAQAADAQATAAGMPAGRPIYFSIDFDASPAQQAALNAYFDGVASVIGVARTGAYAGYYVVQRLFDAGKIKWAWQTYAWSGGQWEARAQLRQVLNGVTAAGDGACCDKDQRSPPTSRRVARSTAPRARASPGGRKIPARRRPPTTWTSASTPPPGRPARRPFACWRR
jgi:hypothetical protein